MPSFLLPLVLDTNVVRGASPSVLERLATRGFRLRIAETALLEWGAHCARKWEAEEWSRLRTRRQFFGRARSIAPFLDPEVPIAVDGGLLTHGIVAEADGQPRFEEADVRERALKDRWNQIVGVELTDEEFREAGAVANHHLDELDANIVALARREEELYGNPIPQDVDPALVSKGYAQWGVMEDCERLAELRKYAVATWRLSPAAAERLDAHVCTTTYRLHRAARGARMPKENDGADIGLTAHIGAGCILLTDERQLVEIVDASGTFQSPWVRRLNDLDELPDGLPWGDAARRRAATFRRRP